MRGWRQARTVCRIVSGRNIIVLFHIRFYLNTSKCTWANTHWSSTSRYAILLLTIMYDTQAALAIHTTGLMMVLRHGCLWMTGRFHGSSFWYVGVISSAFWYLEMWDVLSVPCTTMYHEIGLCFCNEKRNIIDYGWNWYGGWRVHQREVGGFLVKYVARIIWRGMYLSVVILLLLHCHMCLLFIFQTCLCQYAAVLRVLLSPVPILSRYSHEVGNVNNRLFSPALSSMLERWRTRIHMLRLLLMILSNMDISSLEISSERPSLISRGILGLVSRPREYGRYLIFAVEGLYYL